MRFREHRGGLAESMETMQEFDDPYLLLVHLRKQFKECSEFESHPYGANKTLEIGGTDDRIGWTNLHIVMGKYSREGWCAIGFSDGPLGRKTNWV